MQNKRAGTVHELPQDSSSTSSMETVVILAQQREAMLGHRLVKIDAIDRALKQWGEEHGVQLANSASLK